MRLLCARGDEPGGDCQSMKPTNDIFASNEFYEALLRCRDEQPLRYEREVSKGLLVAVENYEGREVKGQRRRAAPGKGQPTPETVPLRQLLDRALYELRLAGDLARAESVNLPSDVLKRLEGITNG